MRKLPTFKGYTVDERLGEFRKVEFGKPLQFVPFSSVKGQKLLAEYIASQQKALQDRLQEDSKRSG